MRFDGARFACNLSLTPFHPPEQTKSSICVISAMALTYSVCQVVRHSGSPIEKNQVKRTIS
jgi:hypothetical protein